MSESAGELLGVDKEDCVRVQIDYLDSVSCWWGDREWVSVGIGFALMCWFVGRALFGDWCFGGMLLCDSGISMLTTSCACILSIVGLDVS